jgi:hypothetical protein
MSDLDELRRLLDADGDHPAPTPAEALDEAWAVERLTAILHEATGCNWQPHAGWVAKTHDEFHRRQAERIMNRLAARPEPEGKQP